jgi:small subunit ribosomal protein S3
LLDATLFLWRRRAPPSASSVGHSISQDLENRIEYRRALKRAVQAALRQGIKVCLNGRLGGAEVAKSECVQEGRIVPKNVDYDTTNAHTAYGIVGVKVWINKG